MSKLTGTILEAYRALVDKFLAMVQKIKSLNPAYKQPGDGSDGTCDCIGLIIGAVRRMGLKWTGIHGSNYAARYQTVNLEKISVAGCLELGDVVYKSRDPGASKYSLPDRYKKGKSYYNGDLRDYYHVGVVTQVSPLRITHMTSPHIKVDTAVGAWAWHGKVKPIVDQAEKVAPEEPVLPEPIPSTGSRAIVTATSGSTVFLRQYPSKQCATWVRVPVGTEVTIVDPGETWCKLDYSKYKGWYMMAQFLDVIGDGKGKY